MDVHRPPPLLHGEKPWDVLQRAMRMLAQADGHLTPDGRIKHGRPAGRRT